MYGITVSTDGCGSVWVELTELGVRLLQEFCVLTGTSLREFQSKDSKYHRMTFDALMSMFGGFDYLTRLEHIGDRGFREIHFTPPTELARSPRDEG